MSDIVITSVPIHGHVHPLLAVAEGLVRAGHRVRFLTGSRFADAVTRTGAQHVSLTGAADFDDRELAAQPQRADVTGPEALRADVHRIFLAPVRDQYRALTGLLEAPTDAVLTEPTFGGAHLLALRPRSQRPPVVGVGVVPLLLGSRYVAPFGLGLEPIRGPVGLARNAVLRLLAQRVLFRPVQREYDQVCREVAGRPAAAFIFDAMETLDAVVQLSVPSFEYPRPDVTVPLHFAGPIIGAGGGSTPSWWPELSDGRPVVSVTQGTIANIDLGELIRPTIDALAGDDVLVVVTTGGRPVAELGPLPANVRAAEFLPYDQLFPLTSVFVTNGGYGGVHYALRDGVPIVVAGDTEDKPEVAARVSWSGTGIRLRTGKPKAEQVGRAVRRVLADDSYRTAAGRIAADIARAEGLDLLRRVIAEQITCDRTPY